MTIALAVLVAATAGGAVLLRGYYKQRVSREAMAVAHKLYDSGDSDLAIRHLAQHLLAQPADRDALALRAEILSKQARYSGQVLAAGACCRSH